MASYQQTTRIGELKTPLSEQLVLKRFEGREAVSDLFEFNVEALSPGKAAGELKIDFDPAIGKNCTVKIDTVGFGERFFVGVLTDTSLIDVSDEGAIYRLTLRPWLALLAHRVNSRVFHNKTVVEIIDKIFQDPPTASSSRRAAASRPSNTPSSTTRATSTSCCA